MSANDSRTYRALLLAGVAASVLTFNAPAFAQDAEEAEEEDRVTVTGTRIANPNILATSPITSVDSLDFSLGNSVNAEQFLNTLPQAVPGFDATSNNPGIGEATVDLRGLGDIRTLVLVNDRRYVSSNQNPGVVDLNTIPASLIDRVDIVTGGASAIYGSDAVAGVVNFILKDDFEGIELDTSYQSTEEGDAEVFNTSFTAGTNFDNGRGNVTVFGSYTNRKSAFQADREESAFSLVDTGREGGLQQTGSVNIPSTFVFDTGVDFTAAGVANPPCEGEGLELDAGGFCTTDSLGYLFNPTGQGVLPFINSGPNTSRYNYAPDNYLQIPQERYSIYGSFNYDITDTIEAYGQAIWVSSQTEQLLAPTPVFTTLTVNLDNPFLAGDEQALAVLAAASTGDADGNGVADAQILTGRRLQEVGGRLSDIDNDSFQFQGGLRGTVWDWNWDLFGSFGQARSSIIQTGNVSRSAYQAAVREGRANIFVENGVSGDVASEIERIGAIQGVTEQTVVSGSMAGDLDMIKSPFADTPFSVAFGAEYREESLNVRVDSVLGPDVAGFNQAPATAGSFDVYEFFAEGALVLVEDYRFVEDLSVTGAYRYSDYSTVGAVNTYALGASWTPIEGLRLRSQFQRAVRAPNLGELFQPQVNGFPNIADPCSGGVNGGFSDETDIDQCIANGVPAAAVGTEIQANAQIEGFFGGNPDLGEEISDTFTIGAVFEPTFVDNLTITVDYYDIQIEDVISNIPSQTIFDLCFVQSQGQFCNAIRRLPNGAVDDFDSFAQNAAELASSGVDVSVDYSYDFGKFGNFGVYSLLSYIEEASFLPLPTSDLIDCPGFYGGECGEPTPEFKANTRFDWSLGPWAARLRWTYISSVEDDAFRSGGDTDLAVPDVDAYNQVDLTGYWTVNDNVFLSVGVQNIFDTDYVIIGDGSAEQSNTYPATYDVFGRQYFGRIVLSY